MRIFFIALFLCLAQITYAQSHSKKNSTMPDQPQTRALKAFIAKKKFLPEKLYPGAPTELDRLHFESIINSLATHLLAIADHPNIKPKLMDAFKTAYPALEEADTEERERSLGYFEELMDILGVESSDGMLNKLLYGFNPQQTAEERNRDAMAAMSKEERVFAAQLNALTIQNAQSFLFSALGKPTDSKGQTHLWLSNEDPNYFLSFVTEPKAMIIWMVKGRFMYSRQW